MGIFDPIIIVCGKQRRGLAYTEANWKRVDSLPPELEYRDPDHESSRSKYWFTNSGVYRKSDHWGPVIGTCSWYIDGETYDELVSIIGYCRWDDFKDKERFAMRNHKCADMRKRASWRRIASNIAWDVADQAADIIKENVEGGYADRYYPMDVISDAVFSAIDNNCIYYADQWKIIEDYGDVQAIWDFVMSDGAAYEDFTGDIYTNLEQLIPEGYDSWEQYIEEYGREDDEDEDYYVARRRRAYRKPRIMNANKTNRNCRRARCKTSDIYNRKPGFETTFWSDFSIADMFGLDAIKDTYQRAFREWKDDYLYLTDLVMVLNHKLWQHYENGREDYARLYEKLWMEAQDYGYDHLKGEELNYFWRVLD